MTMQSRFDPEADMQVQFSNIKPDFKQESVYIQRNLEARSYTTIAVEKL